MRAERSDGTAAKGADGGGVNAPNENLCDREMGTGSRGESCDLETGPIEIRMYSVI